MLPQNNPHRIRIVFDDHRLVANAGLLLPATLARHLGLRELVDRHLDLGGAPGRGQHGGQTADAGRFRAGGRRLHRRRGCAACWWDGRCSRLRGQGAIHHQDPPAALLLYGRTAHPLGAPPHFASSRALALGNPVQSRHSPAASHSTPGLQLTQRPRKLNVPANSRQSGPRAPLAVSYPAISLTTATVSRHRHPQKRLQTAAKLPSTRIQARTIALVTSSPPFQCPHAVHPCPSVDSG